MVAALLDIQAGSSGSITQIPVALGALKDWSAWLVSIQTAVIGLAAFGLGSSKITNGVSKFSAALGIGAFSLSIVFAAFALGAIPSILIRLEKDQTEYESFYRMPISAAPWTKDHAPPLYIFTGGEHILFLAGLLCFTVAAVAAVFLEPSTNGS